jgi:hypothetical protein
MHMPSSDGGLFDVLEIVMAGRPTKYSEERAKKIFGLLGEGNTRRTAALCSGISEDTFAVWLKRYADGVKEAEAAAEQMHVTNIRVASVTGNWTASAWWLERRRHQDWGKVDRVEITLRQEAERIASEHGLDPDELIRAAEEIVAGAK